MDFLLELAKLIKQTPKHHLPMQDCENCDFNSFLYQSKNCYLCYSSSFLESCLYCDTCSNNKDCVDCAYLTHSELCYECLDSANLYSCTFCQDCKQSRDCDFCYDCQGCNDCFGCVGLRKKEFFIFNERYSLQEYRKKVQEVKKWPRAEITKKLQELRLHSTHPPMHLLNCENTFGDYVQNTKNCYMCFNAEHVHDGGYLYDEITKLKDCYDCDHVGESENCYQLMSAYQCYNVDFSWWMVNCRDCEFGFCNNGCSHCFGCVNVRRKEYHILNQPYPKEEYVKKVLEIKNDLHQRGLYGKYLLMDAVELSRTL